MEARLRLADTGEQKVPDMYGVPSAPVVFITLSDFLHSTLAIIPTRNGKKNTRDMFGELSPADRQAIDEAFSPIGFLNFLMNQPPQQTASILSGLTASHMTGGGHLRGRATRSCGCETDGCDRGSGAKMSPGFLAKVRKLLSSR